MIDRGLAEVISSGAPKVHEIQVSGVGSSATKGFFVLTVTVPARWKNRNWRLIFEHEFHVVDSLGCGVLVGNDVMAFHKMAIDLDAQVVKLPNGCFFQASSFKSRDPIVLYCKEDVCIPRGQHIWVRGRWSRKLKDNASLVINPELVGDEACDAWYATASIIIHAKQASVLLTNVGDNDVYLSSNAPVAQACLLETFIDLSKQMGEVYWQEAKTPTSQVFNTQADPRPFDVRDGSDYHDKKAEREGTKLVDGHFDVGVDAKGNPHQKIVSVLRDSMEAFSLDGNPGHVRYEPMRIPVDDPSKLIAQPPRKVSPEKKQAIGETVDKNLDTDVIEPSDSPVASPLVMVKQKVRQGGKETFKWRMCVDFRKVNDATTPDRYPLQQVDDIFEAVSGSSVFSALDAVKGYHQLDVHPDDRYKTAFTCFKGLYQFKRVPFGLKNAPAFFQRFMDHLLGNMRWNVAMVYIDDVVVYTKTIDAHAAALKELLDRSIAVGLKYDPRKCHFAVGSLQLLGRKIDAAGVSVLEDRGLAILKLLPPSNYKELDSICGLFV